MKGFCADSMRIGTNNFPTKALLLLRTFSIIKKKKKGHNNIEETPTT